MTQQNAGDSSLSMHSQLVKADKLKTLIKPELYDEIHGPVTPVPTHPPPAVEVGEVTAEALEDNRSLGETTSEGEDTGTESLEDPVELAKKIAQYEKDRVKNYTRPTYTHIQLFNKNNTNKIKNLQSTTKKKLQSLHQTQSLMASSSPEPVMKQSYVNIKDCKYKLDEPQKKPSVSLVEKIPTLASQSNFVEQTPTAIVKVENQVQNIMNNSSLNSGILQSRDHFSSVASKKDSFMDATITQYDASNKIDRINLKEIHDKRNTI